MPCKNFSLRGVAVAALLGLSGAAQAFTVSTLTVYTTEASFNAAVINAGTDDFSTLFAGSGPTTYAGSTHSGAAYSYVARSGGPGLYGLAGTPHWLSVANAADTLTLGTFSAGVKAVGGYFFTTDSPGASSGGNVTVTGSDGISTVSRTLTGATPSSFVGFVSTGLVNSVTVVADNSANNDFYPTVGKLVLAGAVPEPETYALMLAGLGLLGFMARRRRA